MEILDKMISLAIYSGYIKGEKPLSLIIVAKPESGKTESLMKFSKNKKIMILSDATAFGLRRDVVPAVRSGNLNHILIPDLLKPLNRGRDAVNDFVTLLNSLTEEGVGNIATYNELIEGNKELVTCGLLTSITNDAMNDKRRNWAKLGFLSRSIIISYAYSKESVEKILGYLQEQTYTKENNSIILNLPNEKVDIMLGYERAKYISDKIVIPAKKEGLYGFRATKQGNVMLKAHALMDNRNIVNDDDVKQIEKIIYWINFELKEY